MNKEKLQTALEEEIKKEWRRIHHNASISRYYPKLRNDYEWSLFWDCLGDYSAQCIEDLAQYIKDETGHALTFYQYGRQGATIAPQEWMNPSACSSMGGFKEEVIYDDPRAAASVLRALRLINKVTGEYAAGIIEWWEEHKNANDMQEKINEMDGKKERQVTVWR